MEPEFDLFDDLLNAADSPPPARPVQPTARTQDNVGGAEEIAGTEDDDAPGDPAPGVVASAALGAFGEPAAEATSEPAWPAAADGASGGFDVDPPPEADGSFPALMALLDAPSEDVAERTALQSYLRRHPRSLEDVSLVAPGADTDPAGPGTDEGWSWSDGSGPEPTDDDFGAAPVAEETPAGTDGVEEAQVILLPGPWQTPSPDDEVAAWPPPASGSAITGIPLPADVEATGPVGADPAPVADAVEGTLDSEVPVSRFASGLDDDLLPLRRR